MRRERCGAVGRLRGSQQSTRAGALVRNQRCAPSDGRRCVQLSRRSHSSAVHSHAACRPSHLLHRARSNSRQRATERLSTSAGSRRARHQPRHQWLATRATRNRVGVSPGALAGGRAVRWKSTGEGATTPSQTGTARARESRRSGAAARGRPGPGVASGRRGSRSDRRHTLGRTRLRRGGRPEAHRTNQASCAQSERSTDRVRDSNLLGVFVSPS